MSVRRGRPHDSASVFIWHAKCKNTNEHNAQNDFRQFNFLFANSRYLCPCVCVCVRSFNCNPLRSFGFQCFISMQYYNATQQKIKVTFGCFIAFALWGSAREPCVGFEGVKYMCVHVCECVCVWMSSSGNVKCDSWHIAHYGSCCYAYPVLKSAQGHTDCRLGKCI